MVFDGASNALGNGIGVVIISPKGFHTPFTSRLCFDCTNNMVEYEACILGLKAAINLRIKFLNVFGDSALVISQIKGDWNMKHLNLISYKEHVLTLLPHFEEVTFEHFPREENQLADALATMSSMFKVRWDNEAPKSPSRGWMNQHTTVRSIPKKWQTNPSFTKSKGISRLRNIPKGHLSMIRSF